MALGSWNFRSAASYPFEVQRIATPLQSRRWRQLLVDEVKGRLVLVRIVKAE
jgi:hypothetical protein